VVGSAFTIFLQPGFERFDAFFFPIPNKRLFLVELCLPAHIGKGKSRQDSNAEQLNELDIHVFPQKKDPTSNNNLNIDFLIRQSQ
jgi:hypothetical protein